ncbi:DNA sulfur modification protein DndB [Lyngbya aestuarii]|uniref:DNA sulfur modification protein DndB n=1 Tax=Lyngbya aestuarii TaxID=118322 RepID=UPI00403D950C
MTVFEYVLPVIRGIQAGHEYYVSMCPVRFLPKLFFSDGEDISPEMRAKRSLSRNRVPEIARYILNNPTNYTFSAITASIDANITFEPMGTEGDAWKFGRLRVPMDARFSIQDGEHRKAAFELALKENPELGYETVAVIFFLDLGLERSQQIFTDLNRYSVRPDSSLNILYDQRDPRAQLVRAVVKKVKVFSQLTDFERSTLPGGSSKLFTLNSVYNATLALLANHLNPSDSSLRRGKLGRKSGLGGGEDDSLSGQIELAACFWNAVSSYLPEWEQVLHQEVEAREVRRDYVHCSAIALAGLGEMGATLILIYPETWQEHLLGLAQIDWLRSNVDWQRLITSKVSVSRVSTYLKTRLGLPLTTEEESVESGSRMVGREK